MPTRSGKVVYVRMIALCDGTQYATFELEYPVRDISKMDRTVDRLVLTVVRSMESCFSLENCDPLQMPTSRVAASRYSNG